MKIVQTNVSGDYNIVLAQLGFTTSDSLNTNITRLFTSQRCIIQDYESRHFVAITKSVDDAYAIPVVNADKNFNLAKFIKNNSFYCRNKVFLIKKSNVEISKDGTYDILLLKITYNGKFYIDLASSYIERY